MAVVSRMPDMWGSSTSRIRTGKSHRMGRMSSTTMLWWTHLRRGTSPNLTCGVLAAMSAVSRIISNFATSEACRVRPPKLIHRRQPLMGLLNSTSTSRIRQTT